MDSGDTEDIKNEAPTLPVLTLPDPTEPDDFEVEQDVEDDSSPPLIVLWDGNTGGSGGGSGGGGSGEEKEPLVSDLELPMPTTLGPAFVDITGEMISDPMMPLEKGEDPNEVLPERTAGVWADLDGDSVMEVIVDGSQCCGPVHGPLVYQWSEEKGELTFSQELTGLLPPSMMGPFSGWVDLDGNGHPDIVTNNGNELFYLSDGEGGWLPPYGFMSPSSGKLIIPNGSVNVADLDQNGLLDVVSGDGNCGDGAGLIVAAMQVTPGVFETREDLFEPGGSPGDPYAVMATPLGPPGELVISAMGRSCDNTDPHQGFLRRAGYNEAGYPLFEQFDPTPLDSHYKEFAPMSYGPLSTVNPMGGTVGDMTLDGLMDLVVTYSTPESTFWTFKGLPSSPRFGFFQGMLSWPMVEREDLAGVGPPPGVSTHNMIPWGVALLDINRDGMGDLVAVHGPDTTGIQDPEAWVGPQHTTLSFATGLMEFEDATAMSGLAVEGHWKALVVGDMEGDGDADLIVGGLGEFSRVFRNECDVEGQGFSLRLKGQFSNSSGHGAMIQVEGEVPAPGRQLLMGHVGSPNAISDMLVFPATGAASSSPETTVVWPSGHIQKVPGLEAGKSHLIEEPELVVMEPSSRRVPADGSSTLTFTIMPRNPEGQLKTDAQVTVTPKTGPGESLMSSQKDGVWTVVFKAPNAPGETVFEIAVDGTPYKVFPRVVWTAD